jgi:hypothetical protein
MKNFKIFLAIIATMIVIALTVIAVRELQPEIWRYEAMAYIDSLIFLYDDKPDIVKGALATPDIMDRVYLYSDKSLNKLKGCIENAPYVADYTGVLFGASPPSDVYVYVEERITSDGAEFWYYAPNKLIYFVFDKADAAEFHEYLIEIANAEDSSGVVH